MNNTVNYRTASGTTINVEIWTIGQEVRAQMFVDGVDFSGDVVADRVMDGIQHIASRAVARRLRDKLQRALAAAWRAGRLHRPVLV